MRSNRYRRLRAPVFSRLTLAWAAFACASVVLGGYALLRGADNNEKIALAVEGDVQTMAPPITRLAPPKEADRPPLRGVTEATLASATPGLQENGDDNGRSFFADDVYADLPTLVSVSPETSTEVIYPNNDSAGSIVITVDGEPARKPGERLALAAAARPVFERGQTPAGPIADLLKNTVHGKIPRMSPSGKRASRSYAKPFDSKKDKPKIAIVVGGLGLNAPLTERAIDELPAHVTLAFAPYARDLEFWANKARAAGHEVVLELPMEAHAGSPQALGPAALLTSRTQEENLERLDWLLSRFQGYFAATNYLGGKFSADPEAIRPVLEKLRAAGVAYIDDTGAIRRAGVKGEWTIVNRVVTAGNSNNDKKAVKRGLDALEKIARRDGNALGKTFAYDASITEITDWATGLSERGFVIAPASAVLHARGPVL